MTIAAQVSSHEVSMPRAIRGRLLEDGICCGSVLDVVVLEEEENREIRRACGVTWRVDLEELRGRNVDRSKHGQVTVANRERVNRRRRVVSIVCRRERGKEEREGEGITVEDRMRECGLWKKEGRETDWKRKFRDEVIDLQTKPLAGTGRHNRVIASLLLIVSSKPMDMNMNCVDQ